MFSTKVLFQKRYFLTWRYNTYILIQYFIVLLLVQYYVSTSFQTATFWKKANFSEKQYSALHTLSGGPLFRSG